MGPVATAIISAVSVGQDVLVREGLYDAYNNLKRVLDERWGLGDLIEEYERDPHRSNKHMVVHKLSEHRPENDPEISALVHHLLKVLQPTTSGPDDSSKYAIDARGANIGAIGDGARIEGGLHFHQKSRNIDREPEIKSPVAPTTKGKITKTRETITRHILHLSDLHFDSNSSPDQWHSQLAQDLKGEMLDCHTLDAMIVSGDVANFSTKEEYEQAKLFFDEVLEEFQLNRSNIVIVPGNHDLNWQLAKKGYDLKDREDVENDLIENCYVEVTEDVVRVQNPETYPLKFQHFIDFYQDIKK